MINAVDICLKQAEAYIISAVQTVWKSTLRKMAQICRNAVHAEFLLEKKRYFNRLVPVIAAVVADYMEIDLLSSNVGK